MSGTMAEKVSARPHRVQRENDLLHLVHEVTSPQALGACASPDDEFRRPDRRLRPRDTTRPLASTSDRGHHGAAPRSSTLRKMPRSSVSPAFLGDADQRHRHVVGPSWVYPARHDDQCAATPTTHGAFGALAFGIGTSQVSACHPDAADISPSRPWRSQLVTLPEGSTAKDIITCRLTARRRPGLRPGPQAITAMKGRMTIYPACRSRRCPRRHDRPRPERPSTTSGPRPRLDWDRAVE